MKFSCRWVGGLLGCVAVCALADNGLAQQRFELVAPQLNLKSQAIMTADSLQVTDTEGQVTRYTRDSRFDSGDGAWLGFYSRRASQIVRWPAAHTGPMQIGTLRGGSIEYRQSQMTIRSMDPPLRVVDRPVLPPVPGAGSLLAELAVSKLFDVISRGGRRGDAQMLRIASYDSQGAPWVLSRGRGLDLSCVNSGSGVGADWWVAPAGNGYVRVETYDSGRVYAVGAGRAGSLSLLPLSQQPQQLWRVGGAGRMDKRFILENVAYPGNCLAHQGTGRVALQPINYLPNQMWMPYVSPAVPSFQPFWRSVSTEIVPNAPLPPVEVTLENNHRYALVLLLGDSRQGDSFEQIRVEPGSSKGIALERDSGATIVETIEIRSPAGVWDRQQLVTAIPPRSFYDLSVYEEHLQSIAIDATGKSPHPIEDVNYVPKSVGWLPLPAGPDLPTAVRLDVYRRAKAANNPGAVRRMDPKQFDKQPDENPLESILQRFQSAPRRKF